MSRFNPLVNSTADSAVKGVFTADSAAHSDFRRAAPR
jgi:hypothetical protein